jgi:hypothetical protein
LPPKTRLVSKSAVADFNTDLAKSVIRGPLVVIDLS